MTRIIFCLVCVLAVPGAWAQEPSGAPASPPATGEFGEEVTIESGTTDYNEATGHRTDCGNTVYQLRGGIKFFADCIEYFSDDGRLVARGNVVFTNPEGRIAA